MHVTAGKKCQYIGNCTFAHSVEERDLWTYMKENNSKFLWRSSAFSLGWISLVQLNRLTMQHTHCTSILQFQIWISFMSSGCSLRSLAGGTKCPIILSGRTANRSTCRQTMLRKWWVAEPAASANNSCLNWQLACLFWKHELFNREMTAFIPWSKLLRNKHPSDRLLHLDADLKIFYTSIWLQISTTLSTSVEFFIEVKFTCTEHFNNKAGQCALYYKISNQLWNKQ